RWRFRLTSSATTSTRIDALLNGAADGVYTDLTHLTADEQRHEIRLTAAHVAQSRRDDLATEARLDLPNEIGQRHCLALLDRSADLLIGIAPSRLRSGGSRRNRHRWPQAGGERES